MKEGAQREIVRFVNALRKQAGLSINDKANLYWQSDEKLMKEVFQEFSEDIKNSTLCDTIIEGVIEDVRVEKEVNINNSNLILKIKERAISMR